MVFYFPDRELSPSDRDPLDEAWAETQLREYVAKLIEIAENHSAELKPTKENLLQILDKCLRDHTRA
jgi:hypothetical protein